MTVVKPKLSMQFDPHRWNAPDLVSRNNCLAYALDEPELGWPFLNFMAENDPQKNLLQLIFLDRARDRPKDKVYYMMRFQLSGLERIRSHQYDPSQRHIIAFSTLHEHYFRLDGNGTWSHKPGMSPARNCDDAGKTIYNLEDSTFKGVDIERMNEERQRNVHHYRQRYQSLIAENARLSPEERKALGIQGEFELALTLIRRNKKPFVPPKDEILYFAIPKEGIRITAR